MGIKGLLPALRSLVRPVTLRQLSGCRVALDMYCLLHRAVYTCATELSVGLPTDKHVKYCVRRIDALRAAGVDPVLVFDGAALPSKAATEADRRR